MEEEKQKLAEVYTVEQEVKTLKKHGYVAEANNTPAIEQTTIVSRRRLLVATRKSKDPNPIAAEAKSRRKGMMRAYLYRNFIGRSNNYS